MTKPQTIILCAAIAFVLCGLYPPWLCSDDESSERGKVYRDAGYKFLLSPPVPSDERLLPIWGIKLDTTRLMVEWVCVMAATGAAWLVFVSHRAPLPLSQIAVASHVKSPGAKEWNPWLLGATCVLAVAEFVWETCSLWTGQVHSGWVFLNCLAGAFGYLFVPATIAAAVWLFGGKSVNALCIVFLIVTALIWVGSLV